MERDAVLLEYPLDSEYILKKRKAIKRQLKSRDMTYIKKKIAVLGGSTTHDMKEILELFLLKHGIEPIFYESEYGQYWQDVMFDSVELSEFCPDVIYIHTSTRNIMDFPTVRNSQEEVAELAEKVYQPFEAMWEKISETYHCPVIQNNFEPPFYRLLGNRDVWDFHGGLNFVNRLNERFYLYAQSHENFYIQDIHYLASCYGLQRWADPFYWHMYKYALAVPAIPELAYNLANLIKSIYGKNKKAFVLDLDNTLWGGIVGDDGPDRIEIGQETSVGQMYSEFQQYVKAHKDLGIMLTIDSKNEEENALAGLNRPDSILKPDDFLVIKANWDSKDQNLLRIAEELNVGVESLVFVDDNPAERHIVSLQIPEAAVPEMEKPERYIEILDRSGFFEVSAFSSDDLRRNQMYQANAARKKQEAGFENYEDYLRSLEMRAEIRTFSPAYMSRISQLTGKSNQFNLTTRRCSLAELEGIAKDSGNITLYGKLEDRFGDNGVVSVVFGHLDSDFPKRFHIDLWLMSCRVLKRNMEFAMMDALVRQCQEKGVNEIFGYYYPTKKNKMVKEFYALQGFEKVSEDDLGNTIWKLDLSAGYEKKNDVIQIEEESVEKQIVLSPVCPE
ncbi:HAD-IIIC family phosphatase [bacterium D16-54]|nr:HAD-IIIC family phosphatase [bacterium D16-54]RKJ15197.1 HAD-IIIC family phosphatase [bacterium D16-56]